MPTGIYIRKPFSEEHKQKMSKSHMGIVPWNKGKTMPKVSEKTRQRISEAQMGEKNHNFGKHLSEGYRGKISETHKRLGIKPPTYWGENNPMWKGGITSEMEKIRKSLEYQNWRTQVFERDNYTCQVCNSDESGNLNAHHVKERNNYPDLILDVNNGITLCVECHKLTGSYGRQAAPPPIEGV